MKKIDLKIWGVEEKEHPPQFTTDTITLKDDVQKHVGGFKDNPNLGFMRLEKEEWDYVYKNRDELIQLINEDIEDYLTDGSIERMITELLKNK